MTDALARLTRWVLMLVGRGRLKVIDDTGVVQLVQVKLGADEILDGVPRVAEYGFVSNPPVGADAVAIFISGDRSQGVVIATNHQASRLKGLAPGEVAIHDNLGQIIRLTPTGIVITAPLGVTINGNVAVTGAITATANITAGQGGGDQVTLQQHIHPGTNQVPTPGH